MTMLAELLTAVNSADETVRVNVEAMHDGTFLTIAQRANGGYWQPAARIRLADAIEMTRAMVEAVKLMDPEDLGIDEPMPWDDGAVTREEVGTDWEAYMDFRAQQLDDMADALADATSAHWKFD